MYAANSRVVSAVDPQAAFLLQWLLQHQIYIRRERDVGPGIQAHHIFAALRTDPLGRLDEYVEWCGRRLRLETT